MYANHLAKWLKSTQKKCRRLYSLGSTVAVIQSNYIPWKGYFDIINKVDAFVIFDEVQFTKRDWRNRNQIKTPTGLIWLTVPVNSVGKYEQKIAEVQISDKKFIRKHLHALAYNYSKAAHFSDIFPIIEQWYSHAEQFDLLSDFNRYFLESICYLLQIKTPLIPSSEFVLKDDKNDRLIGILKDLDAHTYLSGPAAKSYINVELFEQNSIKVEWMDYSKYTSYVQLHGPFTHQVSILDMLLNCGTAQTVSFFEESKLFEVAV
jgi:hypothetical protein